MTTPTPFLKEAAALCLPVQQASEQRLVKSGHLQSLSLFIVPHNQHPLSGHALPQHLRLTVIRHLDAEHQAVLDTSGRGGGEARPGHSISPLLDKYRTDSRHHTRTFQTSRCVGPALHV